MKNQCNFIGRLAADPETRNLSDGSPVVSFKIAINEKWKNGERTDWVPIVIFNENLCKIAGTYLKKGSKVAITGKWQTRSWDGQDGKKVYMTECVLQRFNGELTMLDGRGDNTQDGSQNSGFGGNEGGFGGSSNDDFDDELPPF